MTFHFQYTISAVLQAQKYCNSPALLASILQHWRSWEKDATYFYSFRRNGEVLPLTTNRSFFRQSSCPRHFSVCPPSVHWICRQKRCWNTYFIIIFFNDIHVNIEWEKWDPHGNIALQKYFIVLGYLGNTQIFKYERILRLDYQVKVERLSGASLWSKL